MQKIGKGVYRYDPSGVTEVTLEEFTNAQKQEISEQCGHRCVVCGRGEADGVELHIDHIKPRDKGGEATVANGQVLCGEHNYKKHNYNQTETAKQLFIRLYEQAEELGDTKLMAFAEAVLQTYEAHGINGHIKWER